MRLRIVKTLLWLVCVTHLAIGIAGVCSPSLAERVVRGFYGATVEMTPAIVHLLRIMGAYMIAVGILGLVAALDPQKYRPVIIAIAILIAIRVLQRIVFANEIQQTFGISAGRIWFQSIYFAGLAAALLWLLPKRKSAE
jgi:hypothetical protein